MESKDYAFSGKIMLIAIVVLFIVIIIMLCLHVYVRRRLVNARRRPQLRRSNRPQFVFYMDPAARIALKDFAYSNNSLLFLFLHFSYFTF